MAKLVLYYATMNSGKSFDLIRTDYNYRENGFKTLVMKPSKDTKAENYIETRAGLKRKVDYLIGEEVVIDGVHNNVEYIPLCEQHFLELVKKQDLNKVRRKIYGR